MPVNRADGHRERQAEATKTQIAQAARVLFAEHGYAGTTVAAISAAANIPVQTVYSSLGSKAKILERITQSWMSESQTVTLAQASLHATDVRDQLRLLAELNRRQLEAGSDVISIYQEAARADPTMAGTLRHVLTAREREIRKLLRTTARHHRPGLTLEAALDITLALTLVEVYRTLVVDRGWSARRYQAWLGDSLIAQLLEGPPPASAEPTPPASSHS
jgi:AcrR family transcriptional regulator